MHFKLRQPPGSIQILTMKNLIPFHPKLFYPSAGPPAFLHSRAEKKTQKRYFNISDRLTCISSVYCLLITLTCSPKAELRRAQLNGIGWMHVKGASGSRQTALNDPGAPQPSQMFLTWVKARPQHRELHAIVCGFFNVPQLFATRVVRRDVRLIVLIREDLKV